MPRLSGTVAPGAQRPPLRDVLNAYPSSRASFKEALAMHSSARQMRNAADMAKNSAASARPSGDGGPELKPRRRVRTPMLSTPTDARGRSTPGPQAQPPLEALTTCPKWTLADFEIGLPLGKSRNVVYRARHVATGALVALKRIRRDTLVGMDAKLLRREIAVQAALSKHSDVIATLFGFFFDETHVYIVMEYADQGDLSDLLRRSPHRRISEPEAAKMIAATARALQFTHAVGVAHRDIKPANVLLYGPSRAPKLTDYGLCDFVTGHQMRSRPHPDGIRGVSLDFKARGRDSRKSGLGLLPGPSSKRLPRVHRPVPVLNSWVGTADYMSPQVHATRSSGQDSRHEQTPVEAYDEKCDMWALGCVLYECVVGMAPFYHDDMEETLKRISAARLPFPETPQLSADCRILIRALLSKNPARRPTAADVLRSPWILRNVSNKSTSRDF